ncbi:slipin family protein [Nonomuraea angiospora]|uniref:slipin family protein n=1 Tax=Nonomuraea angiospora TaxID=46172 RepID=UPI0033CE16D5
MVTEIILGFLAAIAILTGFGGVRIVNQVERGIVFRFGRAQKEIRRPGVAFLIPVVDRLKKVNVQIVTMPVPTQEGITRDNVSVQVDAVAYFRVQDPLRAAVEVQNYLFAVEQVAQTSLRSIIGKSELDDLLSNREELNRGLALMIDSPALGWGIHIDRVEIKDVQLPESMKRSVARQAEAERERRARVITADGEFQAAQKLADASAIMAQTPSALQLRLLQTVVEVAAEKTSTLVMPLPVEVLRFFDRGAQGSPAREEPATAEESVPPAQLTPPDELTKILGLHEAATRPDS